MIVTYSILSLVLLIIYALGVATLSVTYKLKDYKIDTFIAILLVILPIYALLLEILGRLLYIIGVDINLLF